MSITALPQTQPFRAEDLLSPEVPEKSVEVIEGELVLMTPAGRKHNKIALEIQAMFRALCLANPKLEYGGENDGFLLQRDPDVLLCPDASLLPAQPESEKPWLDCAPLVAVEVLSPSNNAAEIAYKRGKCFGAGAEQVWIIDPEKRSLEFHFADGRRILFQGDETARAEGSASGVEINLEALFAGRLYRAD